MSVADTLVLLCQRPSKANHHWAAVGCFCERNKISIHFFDENVRVCCCLCAQPACKRLRYGCGLLTLCNCMTPLACISVQPRVLLPVAGGVGSGFEHGRELSVSASLVLGYTEVTFGRGRVTLGSGDCAKVTVVTTGRGSSAALTECVMNALNLRGRAVGPRQVRDRMPRPLPRLHRRLQRRPEPSHSSRSPSHAKTPPCPQPANRNCDQCWNFSNTWPTVTCGGSVQPAHSRRCKRRWRCSSRRPTRRRRSKKQW